MLVGEAEQVVGAQARLHVLEGDVVDLLALARRDGRCRPASGCAAGLMSISAAVTPSAFISRQALLLVLSRGGEARQRVGQDVGARQAEPVHRAADTISACVESRPPETPMTPSRCGSTAGAAPGPGPGCCRPRSNSRAAWPDRTARRGSARPARSQRHALGRRVEREVDRAEARDPVALQQRAVGEAVVAQPLLADAAEIDVGRDEGRVRREALRSRRAGRRIRRSRHGRPRRGRSSIRPGPPPNRRRPRCSAPTGCRTAAAASRPCRW